MKGEPSAAAMTEQPVRVPSTGPQPKLTEDTVLLGRPAEITDIARLLELALPRSRELATGANHNGSGGTRLTVRCVSLISADRKRMAGIGSRKPTLGRRPPSTPDTCCPPTRSTSPDGRKERAGQRED